MFDRKSAIVGAMSPHGCNGADGHRRVRIGEAIGWDLVQIAAFAATSLELESTLRSIFRLDLPTNTGEVLNAGDLRLLKTGSEQYWIVIPDGDDLLRDLVVSVRPDVGAVTSLSHSRTRIVVEGSAARDLLAKGIALDLHTDVFVPGRFAQTGLHHTPVVIYRSGPSRYELFAMRTFALSVWEWLIDASLPFGYEIVAVGRDPLA